MDKIACLHSEFLDAHAPSPLLSQPRVPQKWKPPNVGSFKINVDGAYMEDRQGFGIGVVIRNDREELMGALSKPISKQISPLAIELMAIREARLFATDCGFFKGLSKLILNKLLPCSWKIQSMVRECFIVESA